MEEKQAKRKFYTETAYLLGVVLMALATALIEAGDFGVSMIVAPAYLIHLKLEPVLPFVTFGVAEIAFQVFLLALMSLLVRRFRFSYLFSFVTTAVYGMLLDGFMQLIDLIPAGALPIRIALFATGMIICGFAVSLFFHTYISGEAYELFVMEVSKALRVDIHRFKTGYDCVSCVVAVVLSFVFFGFGVFRGIGWGTVITALINGYVIRLWSNWIEKHFEFSDRLKLRSLFEK